MEFYKVHGIGNDYVLLDAGKLGERDWPALAIAMSDRHFGVGSDGILVVGPSKVADFQYRMWNPDGSQSEMCGNGIRGAAKYLYDSGQVRGSRVAIDTLAGIRVLDITARNGKAEMMRVAMGVPILEAARIPVVADTSPVVDYPLEAAGQQLRITCVSMGNPHAVLFIAGDPEDYHLETIGPKVEHHPMFPRRVNFEVCRVVDRTHIVQRTWERGAGETWACGTGASAVAVAAQLNGLADSRVEITLRGGKLQLEWDGQGEVYMTGPAEIVFKGDWPE